MKKSLLHFMRHSLVFIVIYFMPQLKSLGQCPNVDAGPDQTICCPNSSNLNGSLSSPASILWTTSGDGTFSPNSSTLNASYIPGIGDCLISAVILTLGGISGCPSATDDMLLYINGPLYINAGSDQTICNTASATLLANGGDASATVWSTSGTGNFSNANLLNTTYTPSFDDITTGNVTLTVFSTNACNLASDDMALYFTSCTGIADDLIFQGFKIYPSPTSGIVSIELSSGHPIEAVTVLNPLQQPVVTREAIVINSNKATLDFTDLSPGIYFIQLSDGKSVGITKIMVE